MAARSDAAPDTADREIVVSRLFDAPRELVFAAWADPKHLAHWWGPNGFTTTTQAFDLRPGGVWRFVMHGPDGTDYKNRIVFTEVAEPVRLVYQHAGEEGQDVAFQTTVMFADEGGRTRLTMRAVFPMAAARADAVQKYGALEGAHQTIARLGEYLDHTAAADREIVSTRVIRAPRERVFEAFRDPTQLAQWWGPKGFTNTFHEFDLRPGGAWRLVMRAPDGSDYHNESVFTEVVAPERVVFQHLEPVHRFQMTITFDERDGATVLTWRMRFEAVEEYARVKEFIIPANEQNFDRLEEHLARSAPPTQEFVITRTFDARRELVFRAWTEAERLAKWFGPKGATMVSCTLDLRPGGVFHYGMTFPNGGVMWGKWVFREVTPPERLSFVASFSDAERGTTRNRFSAEWPLETLSVVTFTEEAGKTTLTMRAVPVQATDAERRAFDAAHNGMRTGWAAPLDQLAALLAAG